MLMEWSPRFATGFALVDHQHQALFEAVNAFEPLEGSLSPERIDELVAFLARYVAEHFATEEYLMVQAAFPDLEAHRVQHENLRRRVRYIQDLRAQDPALVPAEGLSRFAASWLEDHILRWDQTFFDFLREHPIEEG
jgi:hemerythrin